MNFKEFSERPMRITSGHRLCAGCAAPMIAKTIMAATDKPIIASNATGCLEVSTTIYPYTAWNIPWIHSLFENAAATISGVETAYRAMKKKGKIQDDIRFVAFGGDGGTFDIGLQSLSGALERGHDFTYVCYDNEGYMNTGNQRSSATPMGSSVTTAPEGKVHHGKEQWRKNLMEICVAHNIPYAAQATVGNWFDFMKKAEKALNTRGPTVLVVLSPCILFWGINTNSAISVTKAAMDTCFWPIYEVENGQYKLSYKPAEKKPITEFIKTQSRFRHLLKPEYKPIVDQIQAHVDKDWEKLLKLCGQA
ncbi:MAG: pyruvate ferredoxin oxidoreductase [Candidatus Altiarchaeota archaeon]|nr:pyruvate ferredoxin oxidoreductase [Candidatus Altiarchaeota archaeon]